MVRMRSQNFGGTSTSMTGVTPSTGTYVGPGDQNPDLRGGGFASMTYNFVVLTTGNFDPSVRIPVLIDAFLTTILRETLGTSLIVVSRKLNSASALAASPNLGFQACSGAVDRNTCGGTPTVAGTYTMDILPFATNTVLLDTYHLSRLVISKLGLRVGRPLHTNRSEFYYRRTLTSL